MACPAFDPASAFVPGVLGFVDCRALALGADGYRAIGSSPAFAMALSGLFTIAIAVAVYRLLLGERLTAHDATRELLRYGLVLTLATQWAAYQPLVYDLVTRGPDQLASTILGASDDRDPTDPAVAARVEQVAQAMRALGQPPAAAPPASQAAATAPDGLPALPAPPSARPDADGLSDDARRALTLASQLLIGTTLGGYVAIRLLLALMLALGPVFVTALLFRASSGLAYGWIRVMGGAALGAIAVPVVLLIELDVLAPEVGALRATLEAHGTAGSAPDQILGVASLFLVAMIVMLSGSARAAAALRLPDRVSRQHIPALRIADRSAPAVASMPAERIDTEQSDRVSRAATGVRGGDAARARRSAGCRANRSVARAAAARERRAGIRHVFPDVRAAGADRSEDRDAAFGRRRAAERAAMTAASPSDDAVADTRAHYYAQSRSWAEDRAAAALRSRRTAWIVAAAACLLALVEALAILALTPLKTVVPYTILVDRTTGYAEVLRGSGATSVEASVALTRAMLAQYVIARETYDIDTIADQYRKVGVWSAQGARSSWLARMAAGNPDNPVNRYPRTTLIDTRIESVSALRPRTALVRFSTGRSDNGQPVGARSYWIALLGYQLSGEPLSLEQRLINPLGFQVTHYRRDQETPPVLDPPPPASPVSEPAPAAAPAPRTAP